MNKVSLIATTVITGAVLFTTANVSEAKADEVTANNAKARVAIPTYRISMP